MSKRPLKSVEEKTRIALAVLRAQDYLDRGSHEPATKTYKAKFYLSVWAVVTVTKMSL